MIDNEHNGCHVDREDEVGVVHVGILLQIVDCGVDILQQVQVGRARTVDARPKELHTL